MDTTTTVQGCESSPNFLDPKYADYSEAWEILDHLADALIDGTDMGEIEGLATELIEPVSVALAGMAASVKAHADEVACQREEIDRLRDEIAWMRRDLGRYQLVFGGVPDEIS